MKIAKLTAVVLSAAIACIFAASCGKATANAGSMYSPRQIAEIIIAAQTDVPDLIPLTPEDELFGVYLTGNYLLDPTDVEDGVVCYAFGVEASEITVLLLRDDADAEKAASALNDYKERRISALIGYVPEQAALVERGVIVRQGAYVALLICGDTSGAESLFLACFSSDPQKLPPAAPPLPSGIPSDGMSTDGESGENDADGINATGPNGNGAGVSNSDEEDTTVDDPDEQDPEDSDQEDQEDREDTEDTEDAEDPEDTDGGSRQPGFSEDDADSDDETEEQPEQSSGEEDSDENAEDDEESQDGSGATSGPTPGTTEQDDTIDPAAVLAAWRTGNSSALSPRNRELLDFCAGVIAQVISSSMTEYEKELAIHDWIVLWTSYDTQASNNAPGAKQSPDNDNPYGTIFHKKSICSGYTSTFQLFMDMLGIECITVNGFARDMQTEHAWNMVRLGGEWYCVDVTWDDPTLSYQPSPPSRMFFNVTSQVMRDSMHIWDENLYPEATATEYSWEEMNG